MQGHSLHSHHLTSSNYDNRSLSWELNCTLSEIPARGMQNYRQFFLPSIL